MQRLGFIHDMMDVKVLILFVAARSNYPMTTQEFLFNHNAAPEQIHAAESLTALLEDMERGLSGQGNIPMLPSYLNPRITISAGSQCCVLDAGGTNLRTALAIFDETVSMASIT